MSRKALVVPSDHPLPSLLSIYEIQERLAAIFPEETSDRAILVGLMAARVIFVFLYGGFIEGHRRFMRPSYVYLFTEEQVRKTTEEERNNWLSMAAKPGFRVTGKRWYAETSREPIRDDLMRNQLVRMGIVQKLPGHPTTASTPINYLSADFAALFSPSMTGDLLADAIHKWRLEHLDPATRQRMILKAQGIHAKEGDLLVELPDGSRIRISAGPSSRIAKDLIEKFARTHLKEPALLWLSLSDKKSQPQFAELAASIGLKFELNAALPDVILADLKESTRFLFCEIVATDGAVTEARRQEIQAIVRASHIPLAAVDFLTAFEDRKESAFRRNFSRIAVNSFIWFRTEPELLVVLSTAARSDVDAAR